MSKTINLKANKSILTIAIVTVLIILGAFVAYIIQDVNSSNQSAVENGEKSHNAYANIPKDDIQTSTTKADTVWGANDPYFGYKKVPVVALVHINSIDGGRAYSPISKQSVYPQTYGSMTVKNVYKGDVKSGERLTYYRVGGTVTYDEYWDSLSKSQQDKILHLNDGEKPEHKKYVEKKFEGDIGIKTGQDYVVFLIAKSSADGETHEYLIDGFQYGLREATGSGADMKVLNNTTGEWESLSSIVKLD